MKKMSSNVVVLNGNVYYLTAKESKEVANLLGIVLDTIVETTDTTKDTPKTESKSTAKNAKVAEPKTNTKSKKSDTLVVGSLELSSKYVRTVAGAFLSKKARYAIRMAAEGMGAVKLAKGNPVYDKVVKEDKYVQVYEFKTEADARKFMDKQSERLSK